MPLVSPNSGGAWGIMGGAFDPIHNGHMQLADSAVRTFGLDGLLFIPSYNPPHRSNKPTASFENRIAMIELAIKDRTNYLLSDLEKDIPGPGYTHTIIQYLANKYPDVSWHLILGQDNIAIFDSWFKPEEILKLVKIVVGNRPGYKEGFENSDWVDRVEPFDIPPTDISSTEIRDLIKNKKSIDGLVPDSVYTYIKNHGLYL